MYITKSVILLYRWFDSKRVLAFVALAHRGLGAASTLPCHSNQRCRSNTKVGSGLDVVVEAVDTTPSVPSFKQHTWSFLPSSHRLFDHLFGQKY